MPRDLLVLAADNDIAAAVTALLPRHHALHIAPITFDVVTHCGHDPACLNKAHEYLRSQTNLYRHALVIFDREGCGRESSSRDELEAQVNASLSRNGWQDRARAIVIDPEFENWIWADSPHVRRAAGWRQSHARLQRWLAEQHFPPGLYGKPSRPKEAWRHLLRSRMVQQSSSLFSRIAGKVGVAACRDAAFCDFRQQLQKWFPE